MIQRIQNVFGRTLSNIISPDGSALTIRVNHPSAATSDPEHLRLLQDATDKIEPGGATAGDDRKMNNEPLEREPIDRVRARLEALLKANDIDSCAHAPCQSKTRISHWTAGCFCDGCLGGGAGSMSSGSPSFSIISAISASQARAIAAQLFARTKLGEDGAENFRHLAKRRRHCGRGVGPSFGFPRARKT